MSPPHDHRRAIVPRNNGPGLQQQGSIDWTKLSSSVVSFTVDFLVRIANGGVEARTICAAQVIFSQLRLGPLGEKRVETACKSLRAFSSLNKVLWFGFGIKHVIRQLAESSEGLNCIAVTAALTEAYPTRDAAKILRELLISYDAPFELTPSLLQWMALVEVCGGAFASTDFAALLHDISKLSLYEGVGSMRLCSEPAAIANGIQKLIAVSNASLDRVHFIGGADCGWIAAFAIWALDLSVTVQNASGRTLYESDPESKVDSKVLVTYADVSSARLQLLDQSCVIPSGKDLFELRGEFECPDPSFSYGRVSWELLLQDTFGRRAKDLIIGALGTHFGTALGCAARILEEFAIDSTNASDNAPPGKYNIAHLNSLGIGRGFYFTVKRSLPEVGTSTKSLSALESCLTLDYLDAFAKYEQTMSMIAASCKCSSCRERTEGEPSSGKLTREVCQVYLTELTVQLVQALSFASIVPGLLPSRAGIEMLYWLHVGRRGTEDYVYHGLLSCFLPPLRVLQALFVESTVRRNDISEHRYTAVSSNGLCLYMDVLTGLSSNPEKCAIVHIVPGCIVFKEHSYTFIDDPNFGFESSRRHHESPCLKSGYQAFLGDPISAAKCHRIENSSSTDLTHDLYVEESGLEGGQRVITAMYRFTTSRGQFLAPPMQLVDNTQRALSLRNCQGQMCGSLPKFAVIPVQGEGLLAYQSVPPGLNTLPLIVRLQSSTAQYVALLQDTILEPSPELPNRSLNVNLRIMLQHKQCLYCLVTDAVRESSNEVTRTLCIATGDGRFAIQG